MGLHVPPTNINKCRFHVYFGMNPRVFIVTHIPTSSSTSFVSRFTEHIPARCLSPQVSSCSFKSKLATQPQCAFKLHTAAETSNGSWCIGIKGEMSGTVCVTFTRDIYIYIWVVYSFCLFCCLFIIVTWWYIWCIVSQVASKRKYRHVW